MKIKYYVRLGSDQVSVSVGINNVWEKFGNPGQLLELARVRWLHSEYSHCPVSLHRKLKYNVNTEHFYKIIKYIVDLFRETHLNCNNKRFPVWFTKKVILYN